MNTPTIHEAIASAEARALADHNAGVCQESVLVLRGGRPMSTDTNCPTWCESPHDDLDALDGIPLHRSMVVSPNGCPGIRLYLTRDDADGRVLLNIHPQPEAGTDPYVELDAAGGQLRAFVEALHLLEWANDVEIERAAGALA